MQIFLKVFNLKTNFQYNAFVFRGYSYSRMKLTCEIKICLTDNCPEKALDSCEDNFSNDF